MCRIVTNRHVVKVDSNQIAGMEAELSRLKQYMESLGFAIPIGAVFDEFDVYIQRVNDI